MKKTVIILSLIFFYIASCYGGNQDSTLLKNNYHTLELCLGVSPKASKRVVSTSKGFLMYGINYDYSHKVKNKFYFNIPATFLVGGDSFKAEKITSSGISIPSELENRYFLINSGLGIKYFFVKSKSKKNHSLFISTGILCSYKYTYSNFVSNSYLNTSGEVSTESHKYHYSFKDQINQIDNHNAWAFPLFLKIGYKKNRLSFSITQYFFTHESYYYSTDYLNRFVTNLNLGITL